MPARYTLVNATRKQQILFAHLPVSSKREIAGHPVAAAVVAWYLMEHPGDAVAFVSDDSADWPFASGSFADLDAYAEVTDAVVAALTSNGILAEGERTPLFEDEPDLYLRSLRNIWMDADEPSA
ncbi:hypothetical protein ACI2IY_02870 [Lysobacter enzymogenes]|uniref:hypothetical protein n=1 Tax=Lysobacter enzymogenes TaxID=69 RepID=UPI00384E9DA9